MYIVIPAIIFIVMVAALVDIIRTDDSLVRHLPKLVWLFFVIIMPFVGGVLWFFLGRERTLAMPVVQHERHRSVGDTERPNRRELTTEEQIAELDREIAEYEQRERIRHLEAQLEARRIEQEKREKTSD